jgi:parallel beta-helix repeat protein
LFKRLLSETLLVLLLTGILTLTLNIRNAKSTWTGTVYIRADGSIDPPTAPITTYDNITYTVTDNITSTADGIIVERDNIIIDGAGYTLQGKRQDFYKGIDLTNRRNVTIKNIRITAFYYGIKLFGSSNNNIIGNNITNNGDGIDLFSSWNNSIIGNNIANNSGGGICLEYFSNNNIITGNNMTANKWDGIRLEYSSNNSIFHNNFVDNAREAYSYNSVNVWDDGYPSGGNYWSDYTGVDLYSGPYQNETGSDGIGDTPYFIDAYNVDKYPLMSPLPLKIFDVVCEGTHYSVSVQSNSTVTHFIFNQTLAQISFNVSGISGTWGFCNITIPKALMTGPWTYTFQGDVTNIDVYEKDNETHIFINLQYKHASTFQVIIKASWVIPEYPSTPILISLIPITLTAAATLWKTKRKRQPP